MANQRIRFYLDENMPIELARQLRRRGIDAITVRDLDLLGDDDLSHLRRAAEQGRILCTYDKDYTRLAKQGIEHKGIVFISGKRRAIGVLVKCLEQMYLDYTSDGMQNKVEYL